MNSTRKFSIHFNDFSTELHNYTEFTEFLEILNSWGCLHGGLFLMPRSIVQALQGNAANRKERKDLRVSIKEDFTAEEYDYRSGPLLLSATAYLDRDSSFKQFIENHFPHGPVMYANF